MNVKTCVNSEGNDHLIFIGAGGGGGGGFFFKKNSRTDFPQKITSRTCYAEITLKNTVGR